MHDHQQDLPSGGLGVWARIYIHGALAFVAIAILAYVVKMLAPLFELGDNSSATAVVFAVAALILAPPIAGSLILFVVFPLVGRRSSWRGITGWDHKLFHGVEEAKGRAQIVVVNWPSREVRTMGVLTSRFRSSEEGGELAAVYVPMPQQSRVGYTHIVAVADVEFTDWTLAQWQLYQLTLGSSSPDRLVDRPAPVA